MQDGGISFLILMILMFVVFYFLIIFPENRRRKKLMQQISQMKEGDRFVTAGGIIAEFVSRDEEKGIIKAKISKDTVVEIGKDFVVSVFQSNVEEKK
ncbi:MAG: preprotein translocase subunit YajC [Brevinematales bacterium]|nr:preprotein translocase subunit YajC [Brevinematales bacterium]